MALDAIAYVQLHTAVPCKLVCHIHAHEMVHALCQGALLHIFFLELQEAAHGDAQSRGASLAQRVHD